MALSDPLEMLIHIRHLESPHVAVDNYKREIYEALSANFIAPVSRKIEEELRL
jgi:hypothetical protein